MKTPLSKIHISVVIVSDYDLSNQAKSWKVEELMLNALSQQTLQEPFEVFLIENEKYKENVPEHLYNIVPNLKIVFSREIQSAKLKDYGAKLVSGNLIAVLEADSPPCEDWLSILVGTLRKYPEISVATGKTSYGVESAYKRVLSLIDRSFDDLIKPSMTPYISNNGALYRHNVLKKFPYPSAATPFLSSRLRNKLIRTAGHKFYFEPDAITYHAVGGWKFVRDARRNMGYADMSTFSNSISYRAIPSLMKRRWLKELSSCKRLGWQYLQWWDWPLLVAVMTIIPFLEVPGMLDVIRRRPEILGTSYR